MIPTIIYVGSFALASELEAKQNDPRDYAPETLHDDASPTFAAVGTDLAEVVAECKRQALDEFRRYYSDETDHAATWGEAVEVPPPKDEGGRAEVHVAGTLTCKAEDEEDNVTESAMVVVRVC